MPHPTGNAAKPSVLTVEARATIAAPIGQGNFVTTACHGAGVSRAAFYYWKRLHEAGGDVARPYADFSNAIKKAGAKAESDALKAVKAGSFGWRGSAWFLERRSPKRWGRMARGVEDDG